MRCGNRMDVSELLKAICLPTSVGRVSHELAKPFVTLSRFTVANGMIREVRQAFENRPHEVDGAPGFLRLQVLSPSDNPDEIWLFTFWEDEESFHAWHRSHQYKQAHQGIPKGLKLVPGKTSLMFLEQVAS